jgi:hypothetical protein
VDLEFRRAWRLGDAAEVALEDYARVLTGARGADAVPDASNPAAVGGVHLCGTVEAPAVAVRTDIEDFARELAGRSGDRPGLGWG